MKSRLPRLVALACLGSLIGCGDEMAGSGDGTSWRRLPADSAAVAVIVIDSQTQQLVGADVQVHPACDSCDPDRIPLQMHYKSPGDFGWIRFDLEGSGAVIFEGSIIWAGTGGILHPSLGLHEHDFIRVGPAVEFPPDLTYLGPYPDSINARWWETARAAWKSIDDLDVVSRFDRRPERRVGFYVYTPALGMLDPSKIQWVFFLYAPARR